MKLNILRERYIEELQNKNPATVSNLKRIVTFFSDWDPIKITPKHVMDYIISRRGHGAKPATINREITIMKQFFGWLVKNGTIVDSPARDLKYEKPGTLRTRWLTVEEELRLIEKSPPWLRLIITLATSTGLRRGELLNLKWEDINLDQKILTVTKSKNGELRVVPLTKRALSVLHPHFSEGYVFCCQDGGPLSCDTLEYYFRLAVRDANLVGLHFHDLRHTLATRLVQGGADIYAVQRLLGHKNPAMTHRYSHHSVESLRRAISITNE